MLIPICQIGTVLQLLDQLVASLESSAIEVYFLLLNVLLLKFESYKDPKTTKRVNPVLVPTW